jgi:hypothetical protein
MLPTFGCSGGRSGQPNASASRPGNGSGPGYGPKPDEPYLWQSLTDDIDDVLTLAGELLPLDDLATGPTTESGIGASPAEHILDLILSRLHTHPGKGWQLVKTGLRNRTIRNRNMANRTLSAWPAEQLHQARPKSSAMRSPWNPIRSSPPRCDSSSAPGPAGSPRRHCVLPGNFAGAAAGSVPTVDR